jgi:hypothetical protein
MADAAADTDDDFLTPIMPLLRRVDSLDSTDGGGGTGSGVNTMSNTLVGTRNGPLFSPEITQDDVLLERGRGGESEGEGQGLTLVHLSAQLEPFLNTKYTLNTP